jgi:hypothetical protein
MKRAIQVLVVALAVLAVAPSASNAQQSAEEPFAKWGFRAGFGIDPDQFVFGGQVSLGQWAITRIVPSVDVGLGDNTTTIAFNGDLFLRLAIPDAKLWFYGGGGPTLAYFNPDAASDSWNLGLSLVVGSRLPLNASQGFNLEARFGLWDVPDFKLMLGILF